MKKLLLSLFVFGTLAGTPAFVFAIESKPEVAVTPEGVKAFLAGDASAFAEPLSSNERTALLKALHAMIKELSLQLENLKSENAALKAKYHVVPEKSAADYADVFAKSANAEVNILSPNGGEIMQASTTITVKWDAKNIPEEGVITGAFVDEHGVNTEIFNEASNTGSLKIMLPELSPGFYRLRLTCGIKGTDFYCSSDGTSATKKSAEDFSDGTFIVTSAGPIPSGSGGGGGSSASAGTGTGGGGGGGGGAPALTTIEMQPGNDYYFKGPVTLQQLTDAGFNVSENIFRRRNELFTFLGDVPATNESAERTFYRWREDKWYRFGNGAVVIEPSTQTSRYFIIRSNEGAIGTFTIPSNVTYFGTTSKNDPVRPTGWTESVAAATASNHAPVLTPDAFETQKEQQLTIPFSTLIGNDTDPDGDTLTVLNVGIGDGGGLITSDDHVIFVPYAGYAGTSVRGYTVIDGHGALVTGSLTITVHE